MTYTPVIHQWPVDVAPINQIFTAGGDAVMGGLTLGGAVAESPEPGGRGVLSFSFAPLATPEANKAASWLASRAKNGAVFSVPVYDCVQLVPTSQIFGVAADNFAETTSQYSDIPVRRWEPFVPVTSVRLAGTETVTANMSELGRVLNEGHVIGFRSGAYDFAHMVMAVTYNSGDVATITVSPPLRRDLAIDDRMHLRPKMLGTIMNAQEFAQQFTHGRHMTPGACRIAEVLV